MGVERQGGSVPRRGESALIGLREAVLVQEPSRSPTPCRLRIIGASNRAADRVGPRGLQRVPRGLAGGQVEVEME